MAYDAGLWGNVAEWVAGVATAGALIVTYRLLRHEIEARKAGERTEARRRQQEIGRRQLSELRVMLVDLGPDAVSPQRCADLARRIELDRFEIDDADVRKRLHIVRQVAFTLGMDEEAFNRSSSPKYPTTRPVGVLRFRTLLSSAALTLEHFVTDKRLPPWPADLPAEAGGAQSWIWTAPPEHRQG